MNLDVTLWFLTHHHTVPDGLQVSRPGPGAALQESWAGAGRQEGSAFVLLGEAPGERGGGAWWVADPAGAFRRAGWGLPVGFPDFWKQISGQSRGPSPSVRKVHLYLEKRESMKTSGVGMEQALGHLPLSWSLLRDFLGAGTLGWRLLGRGTSCAESHRSVGRLSHRCVLEDQVPPGRILVQVSATAVGTEAMCFLFLYVCSKPQFIPVSWPPGWGMGTAGAVA